MQRLLDFLATATNAVLAKLKRLALHIIKHPLGSIWWAVKMYFALMFFSLFVACSFGAFAQTPTMGTCAVGTPLANVGCTTSVRNGAIYTINWAGLSASGNSANQARDRLLTAWGNKSETCNINGSTSRQVTNKPVLLEPNPAKSTTTGFSGKTTCTYTVFNSSTQQDETRTSSNTASYTGISINYVNGDSCPPEGEQYAGFVSMHTTSSGTKLCYKAFDPVNNCFKDPKYSIANQFHFAQQDAGKGLVCVPSDSGELCPFKELDGGNGVFQPDLDNTNPCTDPPSTPTPPPEPPLECTTTGSGFKVCKDDPNNKCTADPTSNALICGNSCGYVNDTFMCFTQKDPQNDPNKPDPKPRPDKNDEIDDPQKAISDMVKGDFKQIQRGVETRLDGFAADMANLMQSAEHAANQANKNSAQGNKLLNSINQNTADTVKELKKITEPGEAVEGIEKPEFDDNKNDWQQRNFGTVMKAKGDEIMNLPIMNAISNFFDVSFSGSCPTYAVTVWVFEINIDQFCSPQVQALFPYISAVVLLMCSFFAIRIALL